MVLNGTQLQQLEALRQILLTGGHLSDTINQERIVQLFKLVDILIGQSPPSLPISGYLAEEREVCFYYTNWQGLYTIRRVVPLYILYEANQWHPTLHWSLHAWDCEKNAERSFAMHCIEHWDCNPDEKDPKQVVTDKVQ